MFIKWIQIAPKKKKIKSSSIRNYANAKIIIYLKVPLNKTGSCGIIVILLRRSLRPIVVISIPSNSIVPEVGSTNLKKDVANVDLPQPI
jgi:hypothetical protein